MKGAGKYDDYKYPNVIDRLRTVLEQKNESRGSYGVYLDNRLYELSTDVNDLIIIF